jgi:Undecaprenyl-phosphate glucose phosphotransferase
MTLHTEHKRISETHAEQRAGSAAGHGGWRHPLPLPLAASLYAGIEALVVMLVTAATGMLYYAYAFYTETPLSVHFQLGALIAFLVVAASVLQGAYRPDQIGSIGEHPDRLALSVVFGLAALVLILFAAKKSIAFSRVVIFISGPLIYLTLLALRRRAMRFFNMLARKGRLSLPKILLVGTPSLNAQFLETRRARRSHCIVDVFEVSAAPGETAFEGAIAAARDAAQRNDVASVVLCLPWSDKRAIEASATRLAVLPCALYLNIDPQLFRIEGWPDTTDPAPLGQLILRRPLTPTQLAVKRAFDVMVAGLGVIALAPLLGVIALLIKLDSPGPVLFRQLRYGYNRKPFQVYKFRTMTAESSRLGFVQATRHDARVTRIGRLLRKASIDELPQLFNVLGGTMSLVGPRPHPVELDEQYTPLIQHYATRHKIKPGITGWAQVKGHRGETRSTASMADRISHDLYYLNHWSFWLDIKILLMTLTSVASHRNAV